MFGFTRLRLFTADSSGLHLMYPLQIHPVTLLFGALAALPVALALSNLASLATHEVSGKEGDEAGDEIGSCQPTSRVYRVPP
jgi:hypothetical protein